MTFNEPKKRSSSSSSPSSSSTGTTAHCGLWPVEQCPSIFSYLPPTLSIFSIPAHEDLFLLPLSIFSWVFPFFSSLPVLEWRSFWASYPPSFPLGDLTSLSFTLLSILLYFLLCSSLLVLDSSEFSILRLQKRSGKLKSVLPQMEPRFIGHTTLSVATKPTKLYRPSTSNLWVKKNIKISLRRCSSLLLL